jgi:hypothetical protein
MQGHLYFYTLKYRPLHAYKVVTVTFRLLYGASTDAVVAAASLSDVVDIMLLPNQSRPGNLFSRLSITPKSGTVEMTAAID